MRQAEPKAKDRVQRLGKGVMMVPAGHGMSTLKLDLTIYNLPTNMQFIKPLTMGTVVSVEDGLIFVLWDGKITSQAYDLETAHEYMALARWEGKKS